MMINEQKMDPRSGKRKHALTARDLKASSIGWELALPIVVGPVIGYFIDRRSQTGVTYTLIFLGIGLIAGLSSLIRFIIDEFSFIRNGKNDLGNKKNE